MSTEVSIISLLDVKNSSSVQAELRDSIGEVQLIDWHTQWQPQLFQVLNQLKQQGVPLSQWPQSRNWDWPQKTAQVAGLLAFKCFCVTCDGVTQGLMRVDLNKTAQVPEQKGRPLVYVEYLEVAPWNRPDLGQPIRFKGVGTALMVAAVALSEYEGFKGRIGLHSLPQSEDFYRINCKMIDLGLDANYQYLRYFEMTHEQAHAFLKE